jgi:hypothetical protein
MSQKNPVTPPEIDPETVRLVAQHLNHYATLSPNDYSVNIIFSPILEIKTALVP